MRGESEGGGGGEGEDEGEGEGEGELLVDEFYSGRPHQHARGPLSLPRVTPLVPAMQRSHGPPQG